MDKYNKMEQQIKGMKNPEILVKQMLLGTEMIERVNQSLNFFLQTYFNFYEPELYKHVYDFLRLSFRIQAKNNGDDVEVSLKVVSDSNKGAFYDELLELAVVCLKSCGLKIED